MEVTTQFPGEVCLSRISMRPDIGVCLAVIVTESGHHTLENTYIHIYI